MKDIVPPKVHHATERDLSSDEITALLEELSIFDGAVGFTWLLAKKPVTEKQLIFNVEDIVFCQQHIDSTNKEGYLQEKLKITEEIKITVATERVGQQKNKKLYRKNRLTASNFSMVLAACRRQRYSPSLFKRLAGNNSHCDLYKLLSMSI
ncbi:hypothetical protein ILUMI_03661 [Ignelater luminosus]|uniref:Uncharacterized protein n=1 Tax=Ignelater luminosus TaxID=2038154 RepID=A0A8K0DAK6_IGNLU|nr:hypothetical protein ILUMI_03661 [Ignelater luminosus]